MDTESLAMLLKRLENSTRLSEAGPHLALAHALQFVEDSELDEESDILRKAIIARYEALCRQEMLDALSFEGGVEIREGMKLFSVYMDPAGAPIPPCETFALAISIPVYNKDDLEYDENGLPKGMLDALANTVHQARVERAVNLSRQISQNEES